MLYCLLCPDVLSILPESIINVFLQSVLKLFIVICKSYDVIVVGCAIDILYAGLEIFIKVIRLM